MSAQPQPPPQLIEPDQAATDDALFRDHLLALLDTGATIAQSIKRQAERQAEPPPEGEPPHPVIDLAEQFERVSRAMRRTILLARHITNSPIPEPAAQPPAHRTEARKRIIRAVEDAIQRETDDPEPFQAELRDRLDAPDLDDEIAHRPVADIITDITRDLGLAHIHGTHPWARRTPRDIGSLYARAATPTPPGPYHPGPHGPEIDGPQHPDRPRRRHPPDSDAQDLIALAKLLAGT